jgi:two-component system chemotaxis sensor kinase CheA
MTGYNPLETFLQEADELIADIEQAVLGLSAERDHTETVNRLFRAFHTLKGSAGMCGLDTVAGFTHHVESLLDLVRGGRVPVSASLSELLLQAADHIKELLSAEQGGAPPCNSSESLISAIAGFGGATAPVVGDEAAQLPAQPEASTQNPRTWRIRFHPNPALLANGGNPEALLRDLRNLGCGQVTANTDEIPWLDEIESDRCYLWWTVTLRTSAGEDAIQDVFLFVEDGSRLEIELVADEELHPEHASPKTEEIAAAVESGNEASPAAITHKAAQREVTVRVPAERLDRLVNLVGEFVMNQSCLAQAVSQGAAAELANPVQVLDRLVAELRDNVLGIRMLPIGTLFGRFRRVVHDFSLELGKEVDLLTEGAETELDKSILDRLGEPLIHCLRNCLDHGIEPVAERMANGKPRRGSIRLSAAHTGSSVVVSIEDDGRGIVREAVRAKAIEKQLITPDAVLTDKDVFNLILLPGFSTATKVTSVSGRGVGMDAVRRDIDALRGALSLDSTAGKGTRVSITLPLTLAIIDGLLVETAGAQFIIPMSAVTENVELPRGDRQRRNGRNVIAVRGELIPYIDLRRSFGIGGETAAMEKVVIARYGDHRVGLVVERVVGVHQTVIQSLGKFYRNVEVVSGATIMGDGRVALIVDIAAVVRHTERWVEHLTNPRAA